jgi:hypothetical protein
LRVNNVRQAWNIDHPDAALMRGFYDGSLWESRKRDGNESLKRLIREGMEGTSAVCVLIGSHTWSRRWVRYEIARAVIDGRGLLGIHINSINHHQRRAPDPPGPNPLEYMAVGKVTQNALLPPQYYVFEWQYHPQHGWSWVRYQDYIQPVTLPPYLADMEPGYLRPLHPGAHLYDFTAASGHSRIGAWVDFAAQQVGR